LGRRGSDKEETLPGQQGQKDKDRERAVKQFMLDPQRRGETDRVRDDDGGSRACKRQRESDRHTECERGQPTSARAPGKRAMERERPAETSRGGQVESAPYLGVLGRAAARGHLQAAVGPLDREVEGVILGHHGGCRACSLGCHR
jgi:hypothetical protein